MRVLYFSRDYTPHDFRFLSSLVENGHQVYYLRLEQGCRQYEEHLRSPGIQELTWKSEKTKPGWLEYPMLAGELRRIVHEVQPDVIHAGPIQHVAFLAALAGCRPLVTMSWGSDILKDADRNFWWRRLTGYTLRHSTMMVGDCQAVQDKAIEYGFEKERIVLFPWGIDLQHFCPGDDGGLRERLGWQDAFILLSLRAWEPLYGVDVVVKAFIQAARWLPDLRLLLLGDGSESERIKHLVMEAGLSDRVHYGGRVNNMDLPVYYRAADLYISASHSDGSSVSLMEALASGKPVLVSDIPGNLEWITPEKQGWLFADGNDRALAEGIIEAANQRNRFSQIGASSRSLAEERADWQENYRRLEYAYETAVRMAGKGK